MTTPLRPVFVTDAAPTLWVHALERGGYDLVGTRASSADELTDALRDEVDVVLTDGTAVAMADVVERVRDAKLDAPIVLVTDEPEASAHDEVAIIVAAQDVGLLGAAVARALRLARTAAEASHDSLSAAAPPVDVPQKEAHRGDGAWAPPVAPGLNAIQAIAEHLPVGLYQSTPDGRILYANPALATVLGFETVEDVHNLDVRVDLGYPREAFVEQLRREGAVRNHIACWTDSQGRTKYTCENARVVYDAAGTVLYYEGTMEDVTERQQFEQALIDAREEAEEMARLKSAFLANMSHEIRTPLTSILGYADLLHEEIEGEHREFVGLIEQSGRRLLDTLNSVLELARLEADCSDPDLETVDVAAEAEQVVHLLMPLAKRKGLALTCNSADTPLHASLDRAGFGRILTNLIGNAIKFTEEGSIRVDVASAGADVVVTVRDTGVGIEPSFLPYLFDEFRQESSGHARSHEGSGLGLSITRRLVELHGGNITVESKRPGGTTFTVAFPRVPSSTSPSIFQHADDVEPPPPGRADAPHPLPAAHPEAAMIIRPLHARDKPDPSSLFVAPEELSFDVRLPEAEVASADNRLDEDGSASAQVNDECMAEAAVVPVDADAEAERLDLAELLPSTIHPTGSSTPRGDADAASAQTPAEMPVLEPATLSAEAPLAAAESRTLPTSTPDQAPPPMLNDLLNPDPKPIPPEMPTSEETSSASDRPAVLVVEDNEDTRTLLERLLKRSYEVSAVGDARAALNAMNEQRFDALVLDINLGGKQTGVDILKVARAIPGYDAVFAVALTAYALPGDRERFLEEGFNRYVSKPFTRSTLMEALEAGVPTSS
ncbi:MAG: response regulator [Rhodothermaceae bacterium]|nr:response regulator [Rhodothermaceae bacterium]